MPATCPHCAASTTDNSSFCTTCGKAVPSGAPTGPRILGNNDFASSTAGTSLMLDELSKQMKQAYGALLAVGIVQGIFTAISVFNASTHAEATVSGVILGGIAAVFLGLAFWARKAPLPASIVGLVMYGSLWALDIVAEVATGHPENIARGLLIKCIILGCLAKAVSSGVKHRAILRQQAENPGASGSTNLAAQQQSFSKAA